MCNWYSIQQRTVVIYPANAIPQLQHITYGTGDGVNTGYRTTTNICYIQYQLIQSLDSSSAAGRNASTYGFGIVSSSVLKGNNATKSSWLQTQWSSVRNRIFNSVCNITQ